MSSKAIVLNFKDAKIWEYNKTFFHGKNAYYDQHNIRVPLGTLYYKHVANMLHVLMGERPVSTFWSYSVDKLNDAIADAAKNAMVRIDTPVIGKDGYAKELVATDKPAADTWMKNIYFMQVGSKSVPVSGTYPTWDIIIGYFGVEHFGVFKTVCDVLCGTDCLGMSFSAFIKEYGDHKSIIEFAENYASENKLGQFLNFIRGWACKKGEDKKRSLSECGNEAKFATGGVGKFMPHVHSRLNIKGIETASVISGSIVVPMNDIMLDKIAKGPGCATILEGGVVSIADIRKMSDNMVSDYTKVWMGE